MKWLVKVVEPLSLSLPPPIIVLKLCFDYKSYLHLWSNNMEVYKICGGINIIIQDIKHEL